LDPATGQSSFMRSDWMIFTMAAIVIGAIVVGLILYALIAWRRRDARVPPQFHRNTPLEIAYTLIPLAIVVGLFVVTLRTELPVDGIAMHPAITVDATAFRWSWRFAYSGTPVSIVGTPQSPPQLVLPVDRVAEIDLSSADVAHSFWVPQFLFKRDAIPGIVNRFDLTPTRLGVFAGKCAQFCGLDHALMTFTVRVVSNGDFRRWLAQGGHG
jgi:cytochrome c oxidase subunit 2